MRKQFSRIIKTQKKLRMDMLVNIQVADNIVDMNIQDVAYIIILQVMEEDIVNRRIYSDGTTL